MAGSRVFCCDTLAFPGEVAVAGKHTLHVFRDLPDLIYRMLSKVSSMQSWIYGEIAAMKERQLTPELADHFLVEAVRRHVLPVSNLPRVMDAWEKPRSESMPPSCRPSEADHPRDA